MTIALGSDRPAMIMAVRASIDRVASINSSWVGASIVSRPVATSAPDRPLTDWQSMQGARDQALAVRALLQRRRQTADVYVGLESGFHSISIEGEWYTLLRGWAYATDGKRGSFGAGPSITVPDSFVKKVFEGREKLGLMIDEVPGKHEERSRQGVWSVFTRNLITRSMSFELALIVAFAPFYNKEMYT